jgi:hypothetical protein
VQLKHLRTFQRRVKQWRLQRGPNQEAFFPQDWAAGRAMQLDWTNADELAVTVAGQPYTHLLCRCVLPHSNWVAIQPELRSRMTKSESPQSAVRFGAKSCA